MTGVIRPVPWRDENRSLFVGGMDFYDLSGTGQGPWVPISAIIGADGVSLLKINSDGSVSISAPQGAVNIATGIINVDTTVGGVLIAAARSSRADITIVNEGTVDVRLGAQGVAVGTGLLLAGIKGAALTLSTRAALYGIVGSGSQNVSFEENYGS